ncbi:ABC transporter family protein, putative (macronuclear) [Tetrahymena thermophila SB210]|uniref:ABC transporter family protein, putative n=1 Tax=Tetrahymena thermophila (strain SB210) TaxID=312017 RepID=Q22SB1_TETTS|nr:ABC transporter family protein, putative [Tetrahymena thermophila SB210]EAR87861.2 ABC transporter family protein, putative [Tetrahymena thermophila SB210]|eukprot:XP_001008106.2 ABC transporter family protein, putative [Tetrahymena thermophila SB210]
MYQLQFQMPLIFAFNIRMSNSKIKTKEQSGQNYSQNSFNPNLENRASCLSKALFLWTNKVIKLGNSKSIKECDLFDLREEERLETFAGPIFLNLIVKNIADESSNQSLGYIYASLLFACFALKVFLQQHLTLLTNRITFQVIFN